MKRPGARGTSFPTIRALISSCWEVASRRDDVPIRLWLGAFDTDGDLLDVMVLIDAPGHVGWFMEVRIIVIEAEQSRHGKTEKNDRLLAVAIHSYRQPGTGL